MTKSREYSQQVHNESGYILQFPNIGDAKELVQNMPPNPYAESAMQLFPLGTRLIRGSQEWQYCKAAAVALATLGTPIQSAAAIHAEADDDIVVGAASAIGDYTVTLTSTANLAAAPLTTKDGFKDGYLIVNDEAGEGQMYKIKSHEAASGTSNFVVTLYDPLTVALTVASQVGLHQNECANVIASAAVVTGVFIGINLIAITASYYFWAQCHGPAPVNAHAAVAKGTGVIIGTTAAKGDPEAANSVDADGATEMLIGYPMTPGVADTEKFMVYLIW
jgi:hypothetical protein